jgi:hypothetical protein
MAEFNAPPITDLGNLMNQFGQGQATIANTQAQAGLAQAQTQGAQLQNQMTAMQQQLFKSGLNGLLTGVNASKADTSGDTGPGSAQRTNIFDTAAVDAGLRQRWFVDPAGTPGQQKQLQLAQLTQNPGLIGLAQTQIDQGVKSQTAANQKDSSVMYDQMASVTSAKDNGASPFAALEAVNPAAAAQIAQSTDDPATRDSAAYELANHVAASVHQYTGRPVEADTAGVYRDKITGMPVAGLPQAGLSTTQWMEAAKDAYSLVPVPDGQGGTTMTPKYLTPGQPGGGNAAAYIKAMLQQQTKAAALSPTMSGAPAAQANAAANAAAKRGAVNAPVAGSSDPTMNKALADPTYKLSAQPDLPVPKAGSTPNTTQAAALADVASSRASTFKDTQGMIAAQQQSLTFYKAAQQILANPNGYRPGAINEVLAQAKRWVPGFESLDTSDYQQVVKYLSNAAIQSAAQIFPKMTDSAKKLALTTLNPNAAQNPAALNEMVKTNMANSQYVIDTANRFKTYNMAGGDPRSFYDWNRQYFPQEKAVVPDKGTLPAAAQARLKEGTHTTFGNGQVWTLQGGKPVQVQ